LGDLHSALKNRIPPRELAFDIDGVFADTFRVFVDTARKDYGVRIEYEDITEYEFLSVIDMEEAIASEIIDRILSDPIRMGIKPMRGSVQVLSKLAHTGPILFVTARPEKEAISAWVTQKLRRADSGLIRVEATATHLQKLPVLLNHGIRYFVEDRLDTCYLIEEASLVPIVFEQPWNKKAHPFCRVKDWWELAALIDWGERSPDSA
jgi:5'(3')-deoxyribonucleotidase